MYLIDTHCHLLHERYAEEPPLAPATYLADAAAAGVKRVLGVGCRRDEWQPYLSLAIENKDNLSIILGIHPHDAGEGGLVSEQELAALAAHPQVVALGETGLDYHYDLAPRSIQRDSFNIHMEAAKKAGIPVVVHTREAESDTLAILQDFPNVPFVLHCFSSSANMAEKSVNLGGYLSFSGILTFKKSQELRQIAASVPKDRVLIETDAPYLAPEPYRSRRNASTLLPFTAQTLADVWQMSVTEAAQITTRNTQRLFARLPSL